MKRDWKLKLIWAVAILACVILLGFLGYRQWLRPTHILVVNALESQQADIVRNNNSKHIVVDCVDTEEMEEVKGYDAIIFYGRRLFLKPEQAESVKHAAENGTVVFTKSVRGSGSTVNYNLTDSQKNLLQEYFSNENRHNYQNGLRCLRHIATPHRWGDQDYEKPVEVLRNMYYHRQYGKYFRTAKQLTNYLKENNLYNKQGKNLALISGITFPMEGNREHIDTLITLLTKRGFNVYPMTCEGKKRESMLKELSPDAIVYFAMGRIGNDSLISWLHEKNILLFTPFPISMPHDKWANEKQPLSSGTKNARIVIPEIDGGIAQYCVATQDKSREGFFVRNAEIERCNSFVDYVYNHLSLRTKPNSEKHIAIGYFKRPGKDALLASGMEVIPSLYNFLKRLQSEGYNVSGLPATLEQFAKDIKTEGIVLGSYAVGTQQKYMKSGHPLWLTAKQYEQWAKEVLPADKYAEVVKRYGEAPGNLLSRGDSIAVACVRYGNILLFPQPRPALGNDDFELIHGVDVAPPHSYIAPYLYVQKGFQADALIHFGTHGNLEFTPGREVAMRRSDWSDVLVGNIPHFYYYTTGNVGESIIAKRRSHAILLTYLTPPYAESGMREKYSRLLADVHSALNRQNDKPLLLRVKKEIVAEGLNRELGLDGNLNKAYTHEELERIDAHLEELSNEKMQGAYYTLGVPYSQRDLLNTTLAIAADPLAYELARKDRDNGKISTKQLQDYAFVAHHYLPTARQQIANGMRNPNSHLSPSLQSAVDYSRKLQLSTRLELDNMIRALNGGSVAPVPGGDPIVNPVVLPTGRNMFSINPENTPDPQAWEDGKRLAEETLMRYRQQHGNYPQKVSYTFWAGEFINSQGATIAQALWMLGVEPLRDSQGRISDIRLVPSDKLGRPRINVVVQVSGQLRDIASSRLKLITEAVKMASAADEKDNYVSKGTRMQEKALIEKGLSPKRARQLSTMRVFGPANNGYSTGMMDFIERSGTWEKSSELTDGYLNNMGAVYSDDDNWGTYEKGLFESALKETEVIIQPRQSNTWGPVSLDHVYEFTGGLSLTVKAITGKEPDAYMADYRNSQNRRLQDTKEAVAVEMRTTLLNPVFVKERMQGDEGTAQMFGEMFRNVFGWNVTRPSSLDKETYNDLYRMYIADENKLGVKDYFQKVNPAAFQSMTAVMLESARKGYWKPSAQQLRSTAQLHAQITRESGAACTDFVCNNNKLQRFISGQLDAKSREQYEKDMANVKGVADGQKNTVLEEESSRKSPDSKVSFNTLLIPVVVIAVIILVVVYLKRRNQ